MRELTLLSLFDGSGGFPLAASMCGIRPVACSEVEPYPIAVTKSRFPNMKHLGSVTDTCGCEIEPVDIITFGSPCQDLSVAGKRAGLKHEANGDDETTRSGLFMEAVRIIKEMREATNGEYPTFAVWENVPGAFSSNKGEDFRTVLEELIKIVEPTAVMPAVPKNGWPYADSYCGDGWSLAYRVFDAQYWGVPQRRRRIYLVLDLRGQRAREVLFERQGLRGDFATFKTTGQGTAGDAANRTGDDDRAGEGFDGYNGDLTGAVSATLVVNCGVSTGRNGVIERIGGLDAVKVYGIDHAITTGGNCTAQGPCIYEDIQATLKASGPHSVAYAVPYTLKIRSGCEGGGKGALIQEDKSATLATNNDQYLFQPMNMVLDDQGGQQITVRTDGKAPTLRAETHGNLPAVMEPVTIEPGIAAREGGHIYEGVCGNNQPVVCMAHGQANAETLEDKSPCLNCNHEQPIVFDKKVYGTYQNTGIGWWNESPVGATVRTPCGGDSTLANVCVEKNNILYIVRRLTPTECARLQGFPDDWGHPDHKEDFTDEEYRFWLNVRNTHAAINGKAVKTYTKEQMLTWYNGLHTDSSEYKMWGNGIALPCALYVMQGIQDALGSCCTVQDGSEKKTVSDPEKEIMRGLLLDIGRKLEELEERIREVLA